MKVYRNKYGIKRVSLHVNGLHVGVTMRNVKLNAATAWEWDFKGVDYVCD